MIYGLYLSAQGADAAAFQQAVLANNLANAGLTAFKRDIPVFRAFPPFDAAQLRPSEAPETINAQTGGMAVDGTATDFSSFQQGSLKQTDSDFDLALVGPGFFEVGSDRQRLLTRNGQIRVNPERLLIAADSGLPLLSVDGEPIEVPEGLTGLSVDEDGSVVGLRADNGPTSLGQLSLVEPQSPEQLVKEGNSLYSNLGGSQPAASTLVRQGMLEESNVEPMTEMVQMIQSSRGFEMNMNLVRLQDETMAQLLQSIPRKA
jgi:flagellar basal body rod protein FlgG